MQLYRLNEGDVLDARSMDTAGECVEALLQLLRHWVFLRREVEILLSSVVVVVGDEADVKALQVLTPIDVGLVAGMDERLNSTHLRYPFLGSLLLAGDAVGGFLEISKVGLGADLLSVERRNGSEFLMGTSR